LRFMIGDLQKKL